MLQSKQISRLLSQGLSPIPSDSNNGTESQPSSSVTRRSAPLSISLLSHEGIPLTTVLNRSVLSETKVAPDNLRIYSLQGYKYLTSAQQPQGEEQSQSTDLKNWEVIELDNGLKLIIKSLNVESATTSDSQEVLVGEEVGDNVLVNNTSKQSNSLYVVLFYAKSFPDAVAKLKLDNIAQALNEGLKGYTRG
ncbi:uncharacterized protein RJT20DRAFT_130364 [Scheffersomyces xylosifermentans]|uniref:uncharacterized protein n=1 Tax=Scheffersomyces xylosifermentans TaxID=1304137 RepID=UPI00315C85FC